MRHNEVQKRHFGAKAPLLSTLLKGAIFGKGNSNQFDGKKCPLRKRKLKQIISSFLNIGFTKKSWALKDSYTLMALIVFST